MVITITRSITFSKYTHNAYSYCLLYNGSCEVYTNKHNIITIRSPKNVLCNYYMFKISIYGHTFHSSEQAYQWKYTNYIGRNDLAQEMFTTKIPEKAKEIASRVPRQLQKDWHSIKICIMKEILQPL